MKLRNGVIAGVISLAGAFGIYKGLDFLRGDEYMYQEGIVTGESIAGDEPIYSFSLGKSNVGSTFYAKGIDAVCLDSRINVGDRVRLSLKKNLRGFFPLHNGCGFVEHSDVRVLEKEDINP